MGLMREAEMAASERRSAVAAQRERTVAERGKQVSDYLAQLFPREQVALGQPLCELRSAFVPDLDHPELWVVAMREHDFVRFVLDDVTLCWGTFPPTPPSQEFARDSGKSPVYLERQCHQCMTQAWIALSSSGWFHGVSSDVQERRDFLVAALAQALEPPARCPRCVAQVLVSPDRPMRWEDIERASAKP